MNTGPKAAPARWPYTEHRTMARVLIAERIARQGHEACRQKRLLMQPEVG